MLVQEPAADLDAAAIYDLIKPPKVESDLQGSFKQLRPQLRPYQRRAASWMVQREKGFLVCPAALAEQAERCK